MSALAQAKCLESAPVREIEVAINQLAIQDKLGGTCLVRRALSVALLARLATRLQPGEHCETQLSIITKNIAGALSASSSPVLHPRSVASSLLISSLELIDTKVCLEEEEGSVCLCRSPPPSPSLSPSLAVSLSHRPQA